MKLDNQQKSILKVELNKSLDILGKEPKVSVDEYVEKDFQGVELIVVLLTLEKLKNNVNAPKGTNTFEKFKQEVKTEVLDELVKRCEAEEWNECCEPCVDMADVRQIAEQLKK